MAKPVSKSFSLSNFSQKPLYFTVLMDSLYDHTRYFEVQAKISIIKSVFPDYFSISYDYGSELQKSSGVGKGD